MPSSTADAQGVCEVFKHKLHVLLGSDALRNAQVVAACHSVDMVFADVKPANFCINQISHGSSSLVDHLLDEWSMKDSHQVLSRKDSHQILSRKDSHQVLSASPTSSSSSTSTSVSIAKGCIKAIDFGCSRLLCGAAKRSNKRSGTVAFMVR
jgi:hypothetical protein